MVKVHNSSLYCKQIRNSRWSLCWAWEDRKSRFEAASQDIRQISIQRKHLVRDEQEDKMKKPFISMTLSTVLFASAIVAGAGQITPVQAADTKSDLEQSVEKDLKATAGYIMSQIKAKLQDSTYVPRYNDYTQTMLAVKAGVTDTDVTNALTAALKAEDSAVLNPQGEGTKSLSIAAAILYLNELGENPAEFNGQDLVTLLYNTFMTETDMNPYTYQYVNAAALQSVKDVDKLTEILNKIHADVENDYYVDGESGCGIDYYGVSADNNANVLSAWYLQDLLDSETELLFRLEHIHRLLIMP